MQFPSFWRRPVLASLMTFVCFLPFFIRFRGEKCAFNARKAATKRPRPEQKLPIFSCRSIRGVSCATAKGQKHVLICTVECFQCKSAKNWDIFERLRLTAPRSVKKAPWKVRKLRLKLGRARDRNLHGKSAQPFFSLVIEQFTRVEKCKTLIGWRWRGERRPKWLSAKATDSINEFFFSPPRPAYT